MNTGYLSIHLGLFFSFFLFIFSFIFISWRLITLQYCSGFCHTLTSFGSLISYASGASFTLLYDLDGSYFFSCLIVLARTSNTILN